MTSAVAPLDQCLALWKGASTDNEKLAALMLVTRVFNGENSDAVSRRTLFQCIGFEFLDRLLKSPVPEGSASHAYVALSLSLLSAYATDEEMLISAGMLEKIPLYLDCLCHGEVSIASDSAQILLALANTVEGRRQILCASKWEAVFASAASASSVSGTAMEIAKGLLASGAISEDEVSRYSSVCYKIVLELSEKFQANQDKEKFEIAGHIEFFLTYACSHFRDGSSSTAAGQLLNDDAWKQSIHRGLFDILRSRLTAELRCQAFSLLVPMIGLCGIDWMLPANSSNGGESSKSSLLVLCTTLVGVEINVHLADAEADTGSKLSPDARSTLVDCFRIMEASVSGIASLADDMDDGKRPVLSMEAILSLHSTITDALRSVLCFLACLTPEQPSLQTDSLVVGAARLVAVWAEDEVEMLRSELAACTDILRCVAQNSPNDSVFRSLDGLFGMVVAD
eukprot:scpid49584/ scgid21204/ Neurochondrin